MHKSPLTNSVFGLRLLAVAFACCVFVSTAGAHIAGTVFCDSNGNGIQDPGELGIPGVKVTVCDLFKITDINGDYFFSAAELSAAVCVPPLGSQDPWVVSVDVSTVPQSCNEHSCPTSVMVFFTPADNVDFCFQPPPPPPPCPDCVDPAFGLGAAAGCTVLQLGPAKVSITGPAGGVLGDICIAPGGKLDITGDQYITGEVHLGPGAQFSNSSGNGVNVVQNVDLSPEISAAYSANSLAAGLPCTQSYVKLDGKTVTTITGGLGINVICVQEIVLSGTQLNIIAPAGAKFVFNITGKLVLTGGGKIRVGGGLLPKDVLYNLINSGQDVAFSGGGGGVNCCNAIVDGTILAPYRKIALSPGLVNGQIISGKDISIVSGSSVRCPPCP